MVKDDIFGSEASEDKIGIFGDDPSELNGLEGLPEEADVDTDGEGLNFDCTEDDIEDDDGFVEDTSEKEYEDLDSLDNAFNVKTDIFNGNTDIKELALLVGRFIGELDRVNNELKKVKKDLKKTKKALKKQKEASELIGVIKISADLPSEDDDEHERQERERVEREKAEREQDLNKVMAALFELHSKYGNEAFEEIKDLLKEE